MGWGEDDSGGHQSVAEPKVIVLTEIFFVGQRNIITGTAGLL